MPLSALSDDGRAILLLCSSVAAPRGGETRPFGPGGWARIAGKLAADGRRPADLLGLDAAGLAAFATDDADAERMARLLERSGQLAFEVERLANRGIGVETLADEAYPMRLRTRLASGAPPALFVAGEVALLAEGGVAIVGSRDVDSTGAEFAAALAAAAARGGLPVVSGGARGVDQVAMRSSFEAGGRAIGVLPEGVERGVRAAETRAALATGQAVIASPYHPGAGFSAGAAMGRNKLVYALSDVAVVVASDAESGGTWAGAVEALDGRWVPVYVRRSGSMPDGNRRLLDLGALPLDEPLVPVLPVDRDGTLAAEDDHRSGSTRAAETKAPVEQQTLFE